MLANLLILLRRQAVDWRLVLMGAVLAAIALAFHILSDGLFLTPENVYNIAQQTAVAGIIAAVVVLIIVARHIDLSVGSVLGFVGVLIAFLMYSAGWHWISASLAGLLVAMLVSVYQGALTAKLGVPSFVVTLGGLMSFRGAAFLVADGKTQPVMDAFFLQLGGGYDGAIGVLPSIGLASVATMLLGWRTWQRRRANAAYGVPNAAWGFDALVTVTPIVLLWGFVLSMNAYHIPHKDSAQGVPIPVLIWAAVVLGLSFVVRRTRFGRYIFAIGGNPEAAALVGLPVQKVVLKLFALLGLLITVAAVVSVARLNAGTNSLGIGMELYVIAAAVIGGTALSGGSGSIAGSVLGALIMQSIDSGMLLLDVSVGMRYVIIGQVLILAVVFDVLYRRALGESA